MDTLTSEHIVLASPYIADIIKRAGEATLSVFNEPGKPDVETKADDSPVTVADKRAHEIIAAGLSALADTLAQAAAKAPGEDRLTEATARMLGSIPILSEEGKIAEYEERADWVMFWLIDPLDGTKEFISGNGEYTINIALIVDRQPVAGWVYAPVLDLLYSGWNMRNSEAAMRQEKGVTTTIQTRLPDRPGADGIDVLASRRHGSNALGPILARAEKLFGSVRKKTVGSSLKICQVAAGEADWYPRLAPTSEWDTAAADAILRAAGGIMVDTSFVPLQYNKGSSILNPHFHALSCDHPLWRDLLNG